MNEKGVVLTAQAWSDIRQATAWYRTDGGMLLAWCWIDAVESALAHIGAHPQIGSTRYAMQLQLDAVRFSPIDALPYLFLRRA